MITNLRLQLKFLCQFLVLLGGPLAAHAQWTVTRLHPAGATASEANGTSGTQQVGYAVVGGVQRASLWRGTAASRVDLNPAGSTGSQALDSSGTRQVGIATIGGVTHAGLWSGTAASWVDLNPAGAAFSRGTGASGTQQVGFSQFGAVSRAGLWSGTAASWVSLHPAGATWSSANGTSGTQQVGFAEFNGVARACLWSGTAASWVDLNPGGSTDSVAYRTTGTQQVGYAQFNGVNHASLWSGTAGSWEDLSLALPGSWGNSNAWSIWSDGTNTFVAGYGYNNATRRNEALLWSQPVLPTLAIHLTAPGSVTVSWSARPGFVLQESSTLASASWQNSASGAQNPVIIDVGFTNRFYRLRRP